MKGKNVFRILVLTLLILFLGLYFTQTPEFSSIEAKKKASLTEEQIRQFEEDVKKGKPVDIDSYSLQNQKHYENPISDFTLGASKQIQSVFDTGMKYLFKALEGMAPSSGQE